MIYSSFNIVYILLVALAVIVSIVLHELAHGYAALLNGDATAKYSGRLTINPLAHFDAIGFFMLITVGFGFAKPVPVNTNNFRNRKKGIFTVAIAGITLNIILAFLCFGVYALFIFLQHKFSSAVTVLAYFRTFFELMIIVNLNLFFFNLLPIHPLDGFRIIEAFTRYNNKAVMFFRKYGQFFLLALVGVSILVDIFALPMYFDPLGMYIYYARSGTMWLFGKFWSLFFHI